MKSIRRTWIALMVLTALGFGFRATMDGVGIPTVVIALAVIKAWLVLYRFMELRDGHPVWRWSLGLAVLLLALAVLLSVPITGHIPIPDPAP